MTTAPVVVVGAALMVPTAVVVGRGVGVMTGGVTTVVADRTGGLTVDVSVLTLTTGELSTGGTE